MNKIGCYKCNLPYDQWNYDLIVPDDVWRRISPTGSEGGLLCGHCLCQSIAKNIGSEEVNATIFTVKENKNMNEKVQITPERLDYDAEYVDQLAAEIELTGSTIVAPRLRYIAADLLLAAEALENALQQRDSWHAIVDNMCEDMECTENCDSFGHDEQCPVAFPDVAWRSLKVRAEIAESENRCLRENNRQLYERIHKVEQLIRSRSKANIQRSDHTSRTEVYNECADLLYTNFSKK